MLSVANLVPQARISLQTVAPDAQTQEALPPDFHVSTTPRIPSMAAHQHLGSWHGTTAPIFLAAHDPARRSHVDQQYK